MSDDSTRSGGKGGHSAGCGMGFPLFDESADNKDAHSDVIGAAEHIRRHQGFMLGEGMGKGLGEFQGFEVVAICDHLGFFIGSELKAEILWEAISVAFYLFIEAFGRDSVDFCQIGIDQDGDFTEGQNGNRQ